MPPGSSSFPRGVAPFHEPGLAELLQRRTRRRAPRLHHAIRPISPTPRSTSSVLAPRNQRRPTIPTCPSCWLPLAHCCPHLRPGALVVGKSTVPVGTAAIVEILVAATGAALAWNPEFLRQGTAVKDSLAPDRLVYGVADGEWAAQACAMLDAVYAPLLERGTPKVVTNFATAELIKVSANAFLALKLSYINAVGEFCEQAGADVVQLAQALGHDDRIGGKYFHAGIGFGGGCLPKDLRSFRAQAQQSRRGLAR